MRTDQGSILERLVLWVRAQIPGVSMGTLQSKVEAIIKALDDNNGTRGNYI